MTTSAARGLRLWTFPFSDEDAACAVRLNASHVALRVYRALDNRTFRVYADLATPPSIAEAMPVAARISQLICTLELAGACAGAPARWHYVVETDVLADREADFNAWYDQEHLPGLAAVPGTVLARRFVRVQGEGPRYYACYDLASLDTFGSAPWLAVRATPWSTRARPSFRNTKRTMFEKV